MGLKLYYLIPCYLGICLYYKLACNSVRVMSVMSLYTGHKTMDMHLAYGAAGRNRTTQRWLLHQSMFMAIKEQLSQTGLTFMEPCITRCVFYITNDMQLI